VSLVIVKPTPVVSAHSAESKPNLRPRNISCRRSSADAQYRPPEVKMIQKILFSDIVEEGKFRIGLAGFEKV
jgi:hypothetical protein